MVRSDEDGRPDQVRFTLDAGIIKDSICSATAGMRDDEVTWELVERGSMISDMSGAYRLAESQGARTDVTYELTVGLAVPMPGMVKRRAEKTIIETALKGLRSRVEQGAGESGDSQVSESSSSRPGGSTVGRRFR